MTTNNLNNISSDLTVSNLYISNNEINAISSNSSIILSPDGAGNISISSSSIVSSSDRSYDLGSTTNSWNTLYTNGVTFDDGTTVINRYIGKTAFTPVLIGTNANTITYTTNEGFYSVFFNQVFFSINIIINNLGTATGIFKLSLPPSPYDTPIDFFCYVPYLSNVNFTGVFGTGLYVFNVMDNFGNSNLQTVVNNTIVNNLEFSNLTSGSVLRFYGWYYI